MHIVPACDNYQFSSESLHSIIAEMGDGDELQMVINNRYFPFYEFFG